MLASLGEEGRGFEAAVRLSILPSIAAAADVRATQFRATFLPSFMPDVSSQFEELGYGAPISVFLPPHEPVNIALLTLFLADTHQAAVTESTLASLLMGPAAATFKFDCDIRDAQLAAAKVLVNLHQSSGLPAGTARHDAAYLLWVLALGDAVDKQVNAIILGLVPPQNDTIRTQCRQGMMAYYNGFIQMMFAELVDVTAGVLTNLRLPDFEVLIASKDIRGIRASMFHKASYDVVLHAGSSTAKARGKLGQWTRSWAEVATLPAAGLQRLVGAEAASLRLRLYLSVVQGANLIINSWPAKTRGERAASFREHQCLKFMLCFPIVFCLVF